MTQKIYKNIQITNIENGSEVEITGEIEAEELKKSRDEALEELQKNAEIEGFRKGKAPKDMLVKRYGELSILHRGAEKALSKAYPNIISEHKIKPLGQPSVEITKIASGDDLGFKLKTALMPEVSLPDYKKIAKQTLSKKEEKIEVEEKEVEDAIEKIRANWQMMEMQKQAQEKKDEEKGAPILDSKGQEKKPELPEFDNEFVKKLGDFKTVDEFKKKLQENLVKEKELKQEEARRVEMLEEIIKKSEIKVPNILVEGELYKMMEQFKDDVARAGMEFEDYLKQMKKTEEDIKNEWREQAEKKAKMQLIFNKIASEEGLAPDQKVVEDQTKKLKEMYSDAPEENIRIYVATQMMNEKVMNLLTNQGENKTETKKKEDKEEKKASD